MTKQHTDFTGPTGMSDEFIHYVCFNCDYHFYRMTNKPSGDVRCKYDKTIMNYEVATQEQRKPWWKFWSNA